jgi:hypothetical protein
VLLTVERLAVPIVFLVATSSAPRPTRSACRSSFRSSGATPWTHRWASAGALAETALLSANALVPLNRSGLRTDVVPTVSVEWRF